MTVYNKKGESLEVTIRLARPDEAALIITMMKKQHGNNYPSSKMYDEAYVRSGLQSGSLRFAVADVMHDGILAGMIGTEEENSFAPSLIFILLTINPAYRGFALGKMMQTFLLQDIPVDKYPSIYGHCLALDPVSQTYHSEFGYKMTGMLLNRYTFDAKAEYFAKLTMPVKYNQVVVCLPRAKHDALTLYAPPQYAAYITQVYKELGVAYAMGKPTGEPGEPEGLPRAQSSQISVSQSDYHQYCEIIVQKAGRDLANVLDLTHYPARENQTFNVFLNLNDPGCSYASRFLEERGFFFTGVHPLSGSYEYMILHYSPHLPIPFDKIVVTDIFKEKYDYIKTQYRNTKYSEVQHDR